MPDTPVRHYCTLFDRNYLLKGLALYHSLTQHSGGFVLHILCMDDVVHELLGRMGFDNVRLIRRVDFEDSELLAVKSTRTVAEYCWTCTPSLPLYILDHDPSIDLITYLDADLFFFSSPEPIFEEFGDASILIVKHNFAPRFKQYELNGKYNVGWLTFRRDPNALAALGWWRNKCIEWCFYRLEENRMGDQKYLDDWPTQFMGVHVLQDIGANVAPYNFSNYRIEVLDSVVVVDETPLIFYHFHGFRYLSNGQFIPIAEMYLQDAVLPDMIYHPYQSTIKDALHLVRQFEPGFVYGLDPTEGIVAPGDAAMKAYWQAPEWCRTAFRKLIPRSVRARLLRALGRQDHRDAMR